MSIFFQESVVSMLTKTKKQHSYLSLRNREIQIQKNSQNAYLLFWGVWPNSKHLSYSLLSLILFFFWMQADILEKHKIIGDRI